MAKAGKSGAGRGGSGKSGSGKTSDKKPGKPVLEGKAEDAAPRKKRSTSPLEFIQQVRAEGQKVTWTSRNETMISTIMVLIMVAIMSLFFFSVDQLLRFVVPRLLSLNLF